MQRAETGQPTKQKQTTQSKLEHIWNSLQMPDNLRLDMAIKYSSDDHIPLLEDVSYYISLLFVKTVIEYYMMIYSTLKIPF